MSVATIMARLSHLQHQQLSMVINWTFTTVNAWQGVNVRSKRVRKLKKGMYDNLEGTFASYESCKKARDEWHEEKGGIYRYQAYGSKDSYGCFSNFVFEQLEQLLDNLTNDTKYSMWEYNGLNQIDRVNELIEEGLLNENNNLISRLIA